MNQETKLQKYLMADGKYDTNAMHRMFSNFSTPKLFEAGDVVRITAREDASPHLKQFIGEGRLGKAYSVFITVDTSKHCNHWNYDAVLSGDLDRFSLGNPGIEVGKVEAEISLPDYIQFRDSSIEWLENAVSHEDFAAAIAHNRTVGERPPVPMNEELRVKLESYKHERTGYYIIRKILVDFDGMSENDAGFVEMFADSIGFAGSKYSQEYQQAVAWNNAKMAGQISAEKEQAEKEIDELLAMSERTQSQWLRLVDLGVAEIIGDIADPDTNPYFVMKRTKPTTYETEEELAARGL